MAENQGLVLIVDDEPDLVEVYEQILGSEGFQTMTAKNGIEGIQLLENHISEISLVISDLKMPVMGGDKFFEIAQANIK